MGRHSRSGPFSKIENPFSMSGLESRTIQLVAGYNTDFKPTFIFLKII